VKVIARKMGLVAISLSGNVFSGGAYGQSIFTVSKTGEFHHRLSDLPGAYDLAADVQRSNADPDSLKDFLNTDTVGFDGKWKAGNATVFVKAPGYPTFNAQTGSADFTFEKVDSIYKAGPTLVAQDNPGTGSKHVYIAKLRGGSEYVIVKFLTRLGGSSGTTGSTTFEYWKTASNSSPTAIKAIAGPDQRTIRLKPVAGRYDIGLDGNTNGLRVLNMLGRNVPEARVSNQQYIIPIGN
jgi:hypothetical protein